MKEAVAKALLEIDAVGFSPQNPIRFKSGILSPVYVDNRRLPYYPEQWQVVIEGFQSKIRAGNINFDVIAGVAVGGVPHSSALGFAMQKPSVFVRKEAKEHGKGQRIEGGDLEGKRVLLVEDLVTTGGSSLSGVEALREAGAIVDILLAIVSYGFQEARDNFESAAVNLQTITDFTAILQIALEMGVFGKEEHAIIDDWFKDPHGWASRHHK
jgi:orotate phosphoribosyltransferase